MAMNPRLLRPTSSSFHPEALDWRTRVIANGGSVSPLSMRAVSQFCAAIQANGLRDRFYRLNLFAGSDLNACLVPLYNSASFGGSVLGNATDSNNGFVSAEYVESGNGGGLGKNAGTQKTLTTGLNSANLPQFATAHAAMARQSGSFSSGGFFLGSNEGTDQYFIYCANSAHNVQLAASGGEAAYNNALATSGRFISSRTSNTSLTTYRNGTSVATNTSAANPTIGSPPKALILWTQNVMQGRAYYYSIGDSLSAQQVTTLDGIFSTYLTAMGRV